MPGRTYSAFVAIDWSGAKGRRHKGIAIAEARGEHFTISSAAREGGGFRLTGTDRGDDDHFTIRLVPAGGGTEGRLVITDRSR